MGSVVLPPNILTARFLLLKIDFVSIISYNLPGLNTPARHMSARSAEQAHWATTSNRQLEQVGRQWPGTQTKEHQIQTHLIYSPQPGKDVLGTVRARNAGHPEYTPCLLEGKLRTL